jgi:hypothetical protein
MNDKAKRDKAVDEFAAAMKARLDWAAEIVVSGKTGWDGEYSADALRSEIRDDADDMDMCGEDGKAVDIANRCMMLWFREQSNAQHHAERPKGAIA